MSSKFYAIKLGQDPLTKLPVENLIVTSWSDCAKYVNGVKGGVKYKSFPNYDLAYAYLYEGNKALVKGKDTYPLDCVHIYVDGSFNITTEKFAYAFTAVHNNIIIHIDYGVSDDTSQKSLRQVAGELASTIKSLEYMESINQNKVVIFYDYEGIFEHAIGTWEKTSPSSKEYHAKVNNFINKGLNITFVKVDSHTGDVYNEITDSFAKLAADIKLTKAVDKWLDNNQLKVLDNDTMIKMHSIIEESNKSKIKIA